MENINCIIGIDPGDKIGGLCILVEGEIRLAVNLPMVNIFPAVIHYLSVNLIHDNFIVLVEDIQPYLGRLSQQVIDTAKQVGILEYRLLEAIVPCKLVKRSEVKEFVFNTYPELVHPPIQKRIERKGYKTKTGEFRKPQYMWVNDHLVEVAMRSQWNVQKPWKRNKYGLISHSWQALALCTKFLLTNDCEHTALSVAM